MNPNEIEARQIWPTTLFFARWSDHAAKSASIIEHLYLLKGRESTNIASGVAAAAKSASGLFESRFDLFMSHHTELQELNQFIGGSLRSAVCQINDGNISPDLLRVYSTESWFHITNDGGYHNAHYHHNCSWCGIYYLQAGDVDDRSKDEFFRNGLNRFHSPVGAGGCYRDFGGQYLQNDYFDVGPEDGLLVLFPSYLLHSALPYRGQKDRIVISFNSQIFLSTDQAAIPPR